MHKLKLLDWKTQVADTANKVTEAQAVVDSLKNEVSYTIDINLPQEVKDTVKKFMTTPKAIGNCCWLEQAVEAVTSRLIMIIIGRLT